MIRPITVHGCSIRYSSDGKTTYASGKVALCTRCNGAGFFDIEVFVPKDKFPWVHQVWAKRMVEGMFADQLEGLTYLRGPNWLHKCANRSKHMITKKAVKK